MKKIIALILTFLIYVSCATQSHSYLVQRHGKNDLTILWESKPQSAYSNFFGLKQLMEFTNKGISVENFDSVRYAYWKLKNTVGIKPNSVKCAVKYSINSDTIDNVIYFIDERYEHVIHDETILEYFSSKIEMNILKFVQRHNKLNTQLNDSISI